MIKLTSKRMVIICRVSAILLLCPVALKYWMLLGPELARLQKEIEAEYLLFGELARYVILNIQNHEMDLLSRILVL